MLQRNTGNSSSLKPSYSTNGVEYTRIEFGLDSAEIMSKSRTLPRRFHTQQSTPEARSPPVKVVGISGTEYKHIDPIKTKALHITKKEHESTLLRSWAATLKHMFFSFSSLRLGKAWIFAVADFSSVCCMFQDWLILSMVILQSRNVEILSVFFCSIGSKIWCCNAFKFLVYA